jgi:hypothetical protein
MQGDDMNKPTADNDFEGAVEAAIEGMQTATNPHPLHAQGEQVNYEKAASNFSSNRDLIEKTRVLFAKQLESLQTRIDVVNSQIGASIKARDEAVTIAENQHKDRMREHERDLYQIKTLRAAVELAVAALGYE